MGTVVRIGDTVRRQTGPWTPAVHALLAHVAPRLEHVPRVLGFDDAGREVLSYQPGHVVDVDTEMLTVRQLMSIVDWTRALHHAVADFHHPGPWRYFPIPGATLIGHNDIAPYNVCFDGDALAGVFDWDMAGPTTPLSELAFIAWNCVPLWRDIGPETAARRLTLIAETYGGYDGRQVLHAVPPRIRLMLDGIPIAAAAGDQGMAHLMTLGEPERSNASLADLVDRIPAIDQALGHIGSTQARRTASDRMHRMQVTVRRATAIDAPALARLRWRWETEGSEALRIDRTSFVEYFAAWVVDHLHTHLPFVVEVDGRLSGMAFLNLTNRVPTPSKLDRRTGDVQSVYVVPELRNSGVGAALIGAVLAEARQRELRRVTVHSSDLALPFYRRAGFGDPDNWLQWTPA
ncbi:MAG TPA: GNAT family N-acetyltransferase [Micromonosporaceae bacterium]|nr:GNAT family N-acetyltransferase [Micromonosporaceae bacterium]